MRKRKVNRVLQETDDRCRLLLESIRDYAILMLDLEGHVASWNPGAEELHGYAADEIIGQSFSALLNKGEKGAQKVNPLLERALNEGRLEEGIWLLRKDGSRFWASLVVTLMRDPKGKPIGFAAVAHDLTTDERARERFRAGDEQFRRLIEGVQEYAIYMLDPIGNITTWNSGAEKLKQYTAREIIGKNFACFYTSEDVATGKPQHNLDEARSQGHFRDQGLRVRKDGTTFEAEVVLTAVRDSTGVLIGFSKVTRDLTDQIRHRDMETAKIAAEKSSQAKDDFLAALSHELRTPLTPALAAASYLANNVSKFPKEFAEDLNTIERNVQLQARLIDDLLDLTRVARGKIELHFSRVDAHSVIREAIEIARPRMAEKDLQLSLELKAKNHHVWADPIRIQQVFWNLINNAVKFTGPQGHITVRTANDKKDHFEFEVVDDGIGIEPQRQHLLFNAFEQGERAITRQFGGLGLGLAISKNLVDLHDGAITVESRGRSFGATFKVTLDVMKNRVGGSGVPARVPDRPTKSLRILLVEDHGDTRRVLARLLSHFGHEISVADSTQTALDFVEAKDFDLVLSDIGLPDGSGYDIISQAKRKQSLKGVALTGFGTDEDIRRSKEAGFDFHLTKPVDFHELRSVLNQVGS